MTKFIWHKAKDSEGLTPITQVSGFCFDTLGNVLLLRQTEVPGKNWNIPGGHPESGETPDQTLEREVHEETTVRIGARGFIGYQEAINDTTNTEYQLRFAAIITDIEPQQIDPVKGVIHERRFVPPTEVMKHIIYPQYREALDAAIEWYEQHKTRIGQTS